jgi:predicted nucleotidyltransferase
MKIFVDANVIIDYLVDRMPFADDAEAVIDACVQDGTWTVNKAGNQMTERLFNPDYRDMIECLLREGVDFMLVGGYAVALHGWPRTTFDIDFWIMANPENAKAVMRAIKAFGAPLMGLTEADFYRPGMVFQIGNEPQRIDIISAVDGLDYADASLRAVKMIVDGMEIKVLSLDDLIVNKRASGRPKDIADALALEKLKARSKNG